MDLPIEIRILSAERLKTGIVVKFSDGTSVFFSADLLFACVPQAVTLDETETLW